MRKLYIEIHDEKGFAGTEQYVEGERASFPLGCPDPEQWARDLVTHYNATLRPHESPRTIDGMRLEEIRDVDAEIEHDWHKINLVTISDRYGAYDAMRCDRCGVTGKRFGLTDIRRDPAYRAGGFATCNRAQVLLARRRHKEEKQ